MMNKMLGCLVTGLSAPAADRLKPTTQPQPTAAFSHALHVFINLRHLRPFIEIVKPDAQNNEGLNGCQHSRRRGQQCGQKNQREPGRPFRTGVRSQIPYLAAVALAMAPRKSSSRNGLLITLSTESSGVLFAVNISA